LRNAGPATVDRALLSRFAVLAACALLCARVALGASVGQPLSAALAELERSGLRLIYSSILVTPDLRVLEDPGRGAAEDVARRLLAPHGLALQPIRAGTFAIVRAGAPRAANGPVPVSPLEAPKPELQEIAVYASRYRVAPQPAEGAAELTREDIEALPGLNQDVLRVTKYLPGTATNGVSARPYVRGGRQSELAVYYDGIPLFEPFHFKDFQGLLGVLDPAVVGSMDFYSGVLPVRFGDRLSGALDMVPRRADDADRWILGLSPLYASVVTNGRFDSHDVEWLGAARTSTIDIISEDIGERVGEPVFTDILGRLEMPFGKDSRVIAGWMVLDDSLDFRDSDRDEEARASYRDDTGWLRGEFGLADGWRLGTALSHTERHTTRRGSLARDNAVGSVDDVRHHDATTARAELTRAAKSAQLTFGVETEHYASDYEYRSDVAFEPHFAAAFGRPQSVAFARERALDGDAYAAYLMYAWEALPALTLSTGMRFDAQRYAGLVANQFSPRLLFDWHPGDRWRFRAAFGRTHQAERPDELQIQDGEDVFHPVQRADQGVLAVENQFADAWSLRVEAFRKHIDAPVPIYENLLDALVPLPELEVDRLRVAPRGASANGVEATLRWQPPERWSGWLAYSWTQSQDDFAGYEVPRTWDQRNAVNAGLTWTRRPWQLSGTVQWRDGWRRNALRLVDDTTGELALLPRNSLTYPRTLSLDLRATWTWALRASALHVYADMGNAGNRQTPCCTEYRLDDEAGTWSLHRRYDSTFPRYVLLGVNWEIP
jgi:hypothetical protein